MLTVLQDSTETYGFRPWLCEGDASASASPDDRSSRRTDGHISWGTSLISSSPKRHKGRVRHTHYSGQPVPIRMSHETWWRARFSFGEEEKPRADAEKVVQLSPGLGLIATSRRWMAKMLDAAWYEACISIVIIVNAVTIGLEQSFLLMDPRPEQGLDAVAVLEHAFLAIYVFELAACYFGRGCCYCLQSTWIQFNSFLVVVGVLVTWVVEPIEGKKAGGTAHLFMVLRTLRLLRLVRTVRLLIRFKELWMLAHSLMNSASTMVYTLVLLVMILYIFSSIGIELITNNPKVADDPYVGDLVDEYFSNLPQIMLTLLQFVCLDSIHVVYRPLIETDPWLALYFVLVILVVGVVVMNLVTAVIVSGAFEQTRKDQELLKHTDVKRREQMVKDLRKMFKRLDTENAGKVSRAELLRMGPEDRKALMEATMLRDPIEIFSALDVDGTGAMDIDELCEGFWQVLVSQSPLEIQRMEKQVTSLRRQVAEVMAAVNMLQQSFDGSQAMTPVSSGGSSSEGFTQVKSMQTVKTIATAPSRDGDLVSDLRSIGTSPGLTFADILQQSDTELNNLHVQLQRRLDATKRQLENCGSIAMEIVTQARVVEAGGITSSRTRWSPRSNSRKGSTPRRKATNPKLEAIDDEFAVAPGIRDFRNELPRPATHQGSGRSLGTIGDDCSPASIAGEGPGFDSDDLLPEAELSQPDS